MKDDKEFELQRVNESLETATEELKKLKK